MLIVIEFLALAGIGLVVSMLLTAFLTALFG